MLYFIASIAEIGWAIISILVIGIKKKKKGIKGEEKRKERRKRKNEFIKKKKKKVGTKIKYSQIVYI